MHLQYAWKYKPQLQAVILKLHRNLHRPLRCLSILRDVPQLSTAVDEDPQTNLPLYPWPFELPQAWAIPHTWSRLLGHWWWGGCQASRKTKSCLIFQLMQVGGCMMLNDCLSMSTLKESDSSKFIWRLFILKIIHMDSEACRNAILRTLFLE